MSSKLDISKFKPHHFDAVKSDFEGNGKIGRYVLIPGSDGRANHIANTYFSQLQVKKSSRGHNLYLGRIQDGNDWIDVATISTGMGTPSVDLILSELILLGAKRFLRIGTAGSMQKHIRVGSVVFAEAAVRDEGTSRNYVPYEFPAIAHRDFVNSAYELSKTTKHPTYIGIVHSKDSLYAREFLMGPSEEQNKSYMNKLVNYGVVASEMEASHIYVLSKVYSQHFQYEIKSGTALAIIGDDEPFSNSETITKTIEDAILFGINLIKHLYKNERSNA